VNITAQNIISLLTDVRASSLKRFRKIPEGKENWRIADNKMSIADIAHHIIESDKWMIEKLKNPEIKAIDGVVNAVNISSRHEYDNLLKHLEDILERKILAVKNLTFWEFDKIIPDNRFDKEVNVWYSITRGNVDHEIHHRGQISAYLQIMKMQ
jgi:uncharacterized damage-inducible protein DinB